HLRQSCDRRRQHRHQERACCRRERGGGGSFRGRRGLIRGSHSVVAVVAGTATRPPAICATQPRPTGQIVSGPQLSVTVRCLFLVTSS
ncbi:hypothetical protein PENTCL1PPCAC_13579, partial [Pristionchus entomophagus]